MKKNTIALKIAGAVFLILAALIAGCEINPLSPPSWFINANLPIINKTYTILDLLEDEPNIFYTNEGNAYFNSESTTSQKFAKDLTQNGFGPTDVFLPSNLGDSALGLTLDDSTFITRLDFEPTSPPGEMILTFNPSGFQYTISITIENLFSITTGLPYSVSRTINGSPVTERADLSNYRITNAVPSNKLNFRIGVSSGTPGFVSFNYQVTRFAIKYASGRIKPENLGAKDTTIDKPFGDNNVKGALNLASVNEPKTYLVVKRTKSNYQVDVKDIQLRGENFFGRPVYFKYLKYDTAGAPTQPIDSVFNLRLPKGQDSAVYYVNPRNSNVLQFVGNIPKRVMLTRTTIINQNFDIGEIDNTDSITVYFTVELPLHFSILEPTTYNDTIDSKITLLSDREKIKKARRVDAEMHLTNGIPLLAYVKCYVVDSLDNVLFDLTTIMNNQTSDTVELPGAPVDVNGFVNNTTFRVYTGVLDSNYINLLLDMDRVIFRYRLYTDPNIIPAPDGRVRIRATDYLRNATFGTINYKIVP